MVGCNKLLFPLIILLGFIIYFSKSNKLEDYAIVEGLPTKEERIKAEQEERRVRTREAASYNQRNFGQGRTPNQCLTKQGVSPEDAKIVCEGKRSCIWNTRMGVCVHGKDEHAAADIAEADAIQARTQARLRERDDAAEAAAVEADARSQARIRERDIVQELALVQTQALEREQAQVQARARAIEIARFAREQEDARDDILAEQAAIKAQAAGAALSERIDLRLGPEPDPELVPVPEQLESKRKRDVFGTIPRKKRLYDPDRPVPSSAPEPTQAQEKSDFKKKVREQNDRIRNEQAQIAKKKMADLDYIKKRGGQILTEQRDKGRTEQADIERKRLEYELDYLARQRAENKGKRWSGFYGDSNRNALERQRLEQQSAIENDARKIQEQIDTNANYARRVQEKEAREPIKPPEQKNFPNVFSIAYSYINVAPNATARPATAKPAVVARPTAPAKKKKILDKPERPDETPTKIVKQKDTDTRHLNKSINIVLPYVVSGSILLYILYIFNKK